MVQQVANNIHSIGVPLPGNPLRELNSYYIRGTDRDLLIDTGFLYDPCRVALETGLQELGADMARTDILVTHMHADHAGLASMIASPTSHIYMSERDMQETTTHLSGASRMPRYKQYLEAGFPPQRLKAVRALIDRDESLALDPINSQFVPLRDGDTLTVGDYILQVLAVPGHTPGNIMLWAERQGIMFTGDHILFDISPNIVTWTSMEDALGDYLDSLRKVRQYPVQLALPAHRHPGDYKARIDSLITHHEKRLAEIVDGLKEHPGMTGYEIAGHMHWKIRANSWEDFPLMQQWFAVGECMAHMEYLVRHGLVTRQMADGVWYYFAAN